MTTTAAITPKTFRSKHGTARIIGSATTPNGTPGILVECTCQSHRVAETRAIVTDHPSIRSILNATSIHSYVFTARNSLVRQFNAGPWEA